MVLNILILTLGIVCFVLGVMDIKQMKNNSSQGKAVVVATDFFVAGWDICFALFKILG